MLILLCNFRDGRLQVSDQILAINGKLVDTATSHQEAISFLQQIKGTIEIVIARGDSPESLNELPEDEQSISNSESETSSLSVYYFYLVFFLAWNFSCILVIKLKLFFNLIFLY